MSESTKLVEVTIDKLVFGGQGMGRLEDGRIAFVWNALPGEMVRIEVKKQKKTHIDGVATEIIKASPERIVPEEPWYLSTSPFAMMSFDEEQRQKKEMAKEVYARAGLDISIEDVVTDGRAAGYRNKMEFSFVEGADGLPALGFHERGGRGMFAIGSSMLCDDAVNETANAVLKWTREKKIPLRSLKSVIVRSDGDKKSIAGLFIKDTLSFSSYPRLSETFIGFDVYYSTHKSPASVPTSFIGHSGEEKLIATILGKKFSFGLFSFLQVNIPVYEKMLCDLSSRLSDDGAITDFYSGIGSIGLSVSKNDRPLIFVESEATAVNFAEENAKQNGFNNIKIVEAMAETAVSEIPNEGVLIVDPPRAGLHTDVVKAILEKRPPSVFYLSCDLATQARDLALIQGAYKIQQAKLYNFFPRTPHIESLVELKLR